MSIKARIIHVLCIVSITFTSLWGLNKIIPQSLQEVAGLREENKESGNQNRPLVIFSTLDLKKGQLQKHEDEIITFKKEIHAVSEGLTKRLTTVSSLIEQLKTKRDAARIENEESLFNHLIDIISERKQHIVSLQEALKEIEEIKEKHIKLLREAVDFHQSIRKKSMRSVYSWQELRDNQVQAADLAARIEAEKKKKEDLAKQKQAEAETVSSLQKRIEVKNKEQKKSLADYAKVPDAAVLPSHQLKLANETHEQEVALLQEKIELARLKIQKIEMENLYKDEEIDLLDAQLSAKKSHLILMEKKLNLVTADVEAAKSEANLEHHKSLRVREDFNKIIEEKKFEKERAAIQRNLRIKDLNTIESNQKADHKSYHLAQSEINKLNHYILLLESEIDLHTVKSDLAVVPALNKELIYHEVSLRYRFNKGKIDVNELIGTFRNQRDIAANQLKKLKDKRDEVMVRFVENSRETDEIKVREEKILKRRDTIFKDHEEVLNGVLTNLEQSKKYLADRLSINQEFLAVSAELIAKQEKILGQYDFILDNLEHKKISMGLWKRSHKALSFKEFTQSFVEAEHFIRQFVTQTPSHFAPRDALYAMGTSSLWDVFTLILLLIIFFGFYRIIKFFCGWGILKIHSIQASSAISGPGGLYFALLAAVLDFIRIHIGTLLTWCFFYLHIISDVRQTSLMYKLFTDPYYKACFHLIEIPLFIYLANRLLARVKELNKKLRFVLFAERLQTRYLVLLTIFTYATAVIIPLRAAVMSFSPQSPLLLPEVLKAAYSLIVVAVILLFFTKDGVVQFIPEYNKITRWIKKQVATHFYPVFFFIMSLSVISNPYIGYSNLAGFLAYAIPISWLVFYGLFIIHFYIRQYSIFLFMKESDEEYADKFEHAKTYYGFFVIFSFLFLLFGAVIIIARIWEFDYTPVDLWRFLADTLVIQVGVDRKFGFIQLMSLLLFILGGFLASSLVYRFILSKLFDILKTEPGTQNTISKIFHYAIIALSFIIGFTSVHLAQFIWYVGTLLTVGLGFAFKDILADYVAGFFVLIERPVEIGNFIRIDNNPDLQGTVHKIDARTTTIMTKLNHSLIISNKDLINKTISNWGKNRFAVGFEIRITVDYRSDIELVKRAITEVIQSNPVILRVPNIIVRLEDFEESALYFLARAFISARRVQEQWAIAGTLREEIFKAFRERGIKFGFPQRVIQDGGPIAFNFEKD